MNAWGYQSYATGEVVINSVSDSERAVMVNALVTEANMTVSALTTDELIEEYFVKVLGDRGEVVPVVIIINQLGPVSP